MTLRESYVCMDVCCGTRCERITLIGHSHGEEFAHSVLLCSARFELAELLFMHDACLYARTSLGSRPFVILILHLLFDAHLSLNLAR